MDCRSCNHPYWVPHWLNGAVCVECGISRNTAALLTMLNRSGRASFWVSAPLPPAPQDAGERE